MKKKCLTALLLLAPLALTAACSATPTLVLEANWFSNTSTKIIPDNFEETLEYAVSFQKSSAAEKGRFTVDYPGGGTYTTKFEDGTSEDGKKIYVYTTELRMNVQYTLDGLSSEVMEDVVTTRVEFSDTSGELKPIKSSREVHGSAPYTTPNTPGATLEACYSKFDYKTEITYDHDAQKAHFNLTYLMESGAPANIENQEISIKCKGFYFDNEQLIPALRAAELSSSMSIYTIDPTTRTLEKLKIQSGPTASTLTQSVKLKEDETAVERTFNTNEISIAYNKQNSGGVQVFTFAQRGEHDRNTYRNVLLKYECPVINSHGTLTYTLTAASFHA